MIIYSILTIYESQYITELRTLIRKKPILKVYLIHRGPSSDRTPTAGGVPLRSDLSQYQPSKL